jgi:hypothetical protein
VSLRTVEVLIAMFSAATTNTDNNADDYNDRYQGVYEDDHGNRSPTICCTRGLSWTRWCFKLYRTGDRVLVSSLVLYVSGNRVLVSSFVRWCSGDRVLVIRGWIYSITAYYDLVTQRHSSNVFKIPLVRFQALKKFVHPCKGRRAQKCNHCQI